MERKVVPFVRRHPRVKLSQSKPKQLPSAEKPKVSAKSNTITYSFRGRKIVITKGEDGLYRDETGCVYALTDANFSVDDEVRAGIGPFSMPEGSPINSDPAVAKHDFQYACPAYQQSHTRHEADTELREGIAKMKTWHRVLAWPFYVIVRLFGHLFWENDKTNN